MRLEAGNGSLFHVPIYNAKDATTTAVLTQFAWAAAQTTMGIQPTMPNWWTGTVYKPGMVPWNPAWAWPATKQPTDRTIIIVNYDTGQCWEIWKCMDDSGGHGDWISNINNWFAASYAQNAGLPCITVADARTWSSIWTRTDDKHIGIRGCGLDKAAGIVRLSELIDGQINHAINMTISNTRISTSFRRPAVRGEISSLSVGQLGGVVTSVRPDSETMLSGTRFILDVNALWADPTLSRIAASIQPNTWHVVDTLIRTFASYGCLATETGGYGIGIETDWSESTALQWSAIGISSFAPTEPHQQFLATLSQTPSVWKLAKEMP